MRNRACLHYEKQVVPFYLLNLFACGLILTGKSKGLSKLCRILVYCILLEITY